MVSDYIVLKERIGGIQNDLENLAERIAAISLKDRPNYPHPQLRLWSGVANDLEKFTSGLEDWIRQPEAAEARRFLAEISGWASQSKHPKLEELSLDVRFLSDNVKTLELIHTNIENIVYDTIKESVSSYVLSRLFEKDTEKALIWATNAKAFSDGGEQFNAKSVTSAFAKQVKKDCVKELAKVTSFAESQQSQIDSFHQLLEKTEALISSCPIGISEKVLLDSYKDGKDVESNLAQVNDQLASVRKLLVNLEWIVECSDFKQYGVLWMDKQNALKGKRLDNISQLLTTLERQASQWKTNRRSEIDNVVAKLSRMSRSLKQNELSKEVQSIEIKVRGIDWVKPNVKSIQSILDDTKQVLEKTREELLGRLKNSDAILIMENPEIVADMGESRKWTFDRFIKALGVTLEEGLIEIKAVEEK